MPVSAEFPCFRAEEQSWKEEWKAQKDWAGEDWKSAKAPAKAAKEWKEKDWKADWSAEKDSCCDWRLPNMGYTPKGII